MWILILVIIIIAVMGIAINRAIIKGKEEQRNADAHEIAEAARRYSSQAQSRFLSGDSRPQSAPADNRERPEIQKPEGIIDDPTYIRELRHTAGIWQQYDILLAAQIYGWDTILDWAAYAATADLQNISEVTVSEIIGSPDTKITDEYHKADGDLNNVETLKREWGVFSIAGLSETLHAPMKIVWMNQTKVLRLFTLIDDEDLITRYTETLVRRSFHTDDAMKLAKPLTDTPSS